MNLADLGDVQLHYRVDGPENGPPVVFANSLGTDLRLWDDLLPMLPAGLKIVRYDKRGHGLSSLRPVRPPLCVLSGHGCGEAVPALQKWPTGQVAQSATDVAFAVLFHVPDGHSRAADAPTSQ